MTEPRPTPPELLPLPDAAKRLGICVQTLKAAIRNDMHDRAQGAPVNRVPGGRQFGAKYVIFRAVFDRALVEGIEPDAPREPDPVPFLRKRSMSAAAD